MLRRPVPSSPIRAAQGLALAAGTVRPLSRPFFNMDRMRRAAVGKLPSFPLVSDNPLFWTAFPLHWQDQGLPRNHDP